MWNSFWLYQLITPKLLFQFQETKIASMARVSGNSTVLCFQTKIVLQKQKNIIQTFHSHQNFIPNAQLKRKLLKYKIQKFTIKYSKKKNAKKRKENKTLLGNKLKELEGNLNTQDNIQSHIYKKELDSIYDHIVEGISIKFV